jgi:hypothetical protein
MERAASRQAWRVVLGALMVLALISVPGGFVGAKEKPHSEEAASKSRAPDAAQEEGADSGQSSQTSAEDESATQEDESATGGEEATETGSSAEGSESGSAESTGGGSSSGSRQTRTSAGEGEGNQPEAECPEGTEFLVKFEWNGTAFVPEGGDPKGVTITDVVLDEEGEPTSVSFTSEVEIAVVAVKTGGGTTFVTINGTSGTVSSPDVHAISNLTFCVPTKEPPPPPPPGEITVDLVKDNDADGDGTFTDSEEASEEGQDVTFQVVITNTSDVDVQIMSLTDAFGETTIDQLPCLTAGGQSVLGMWLDPDESVTCTFTVQDYAPPAGESLVDTVEVIVCAKGSDDRASDSDTSIVTTSEVLGGIVTPPRPGVQPPAAPGEQVAGAQALAVTGSELAWMALLAVSLLAAGIALLYSARSGTLKQRA